MVEKESGEFDNQNLRFTKIFAFTNRISTTFNYSRGLNAETTVFARCLALNMNSSTLPERREKTKSTQTEKVTR